MRPAHFAIAMLCLATYAPVSLSTDVPATAREAYTCNDEAKRFASWASLAGRLEFENVKAEFPRLRLQEIQMADDRVIRGIAVRDTTPHSTAVLVIGGNGWSAKPFVRHALEYFTSFEADVYYFDFRGYGMSTPANSTMQAILADYRDIAKWMLGQGHTRLYLYAYSFGGVVALASFPELSPFERVVVDSPPSRASEFGFTCKPTYETVDFVPSSCARLTIMHGTSDWVMPRSKVSELIEVARKCGATVDVEVSRGHPFQAEWKSSRRLRVEAVMRHFGIQRKP